ncbi:MAG: cadherin-like beta sandwich domain-containing protein [Lachnospiraceae bacterium]|nr:cadherin-like beta sandwich domain-containing protein [Lachnospiraceae bacterium]
MKRKSISVLLSMLLAAGTLAGCGSTGSETASSAVSAEEESVSDEETEAVSETADAEGVEAPGAYPLPQGEETSNNLGVFEYDMTYYVSLTASEDAEIYYEIAEGEDAAPEPTTDSAQFDEYQYRQIEITQPEASTDGPVSKTYNVKAIAVEDGEVSEVSSWNYTVTSNPHGTLKVGDALDWTGTAVPEVTLIQDYDSDKMYLVKGEDRAMVIDAGYFDAEDPADLYETAREIVDDDSMPIDLVIGHPHPDHVQMAFQFLCDENKELGAGIYVNEREIDVLRDYVLQYGVESGMFADEDTANAAYEAQLQTLGNGDALDLGGKVFNVIELPGHQDAGIMLFDTESGYLFTTDQVGNNRAHITDSFWMQFANLTPTFFADSMDVYQSSLAVALERVNSLGEVKYILTGHNDVILDGQGDYLTNLQQAVQNVIDEGEACMTPTLRTLDSIDGYLENTMTVVVGDRLSDVNYVAVNVNLENYLSDGYRDGNEKTIAELCNLSVHEAGQTGNLLWDDPNFGINVNWSYPADGTVPVRKDNLTFTASVESDVDSVELVPTASASNAVITVNGEEAVSGEACTIELTEAQTTVSIVVTAPDGETENEYTVVINK